LLTARPQPFSCQAPVPVFLTVALSATPILWSFIHYIALRGTGVAGNAMRENPAVMLLLLHCYNRHSSQLPLQA